MRCSTEVDRLHVEVGGKSEKLGPRMGFRRGWRRVASFLLVLIGVVGPLQRSLADEVEAAALGSGRLIWGLTSAHRPNETQELVLNGLTLRVRTATAEVPWQEALVEAHRACAQAVAAPSGAFRRLLRFDGVVHLRGEADGMVACFETKHGWRDLLRSLTQVAETHDLEPLGRFRYLYARRESDRRSAVLSLWSEGPLKLSAAFPPNGDAPGADDPALPRPPGSRRVLSVLHTGLGRSLVVYRAEAPFGQLAEEYARSLRRAGAVVEPFGGEGDVAAASSDRMWLVRTFASSWVSLVAEGGHTWVVGLPIADP